LGSVMPRGFALAASHKARQAARSRRLKAASEEALDAPALAVRDGEDAGAPPGDGGA